MASSLAILVTDVTPAEAGHRVGNDRQWISDFVRDDRSELADRSELLLAGQLALRLPKVLVGVLELSGAALELERLIGQLFAENRRAHEERPGDAEDERRVPEGCQPSPTGEPHREQGVVDRGCAHARPPDEWNDAVASPGQDRSQEERERHDERRQ